MKAAFVFAAFCFGFYARAFEVDNFNCRFKPLQDVSDPLNKEVDRRIHDALEVAYKNGSREEKKVPEKGKKKEVPKALQRWFDREKASIEKSKLSPEKKESNRKSLERRFLNMLEGAEKTGLVGCDRGQVFEVLGAALAPAWMDSMESWASQQNFSKCNVKGRDSVYKDFSTLESPAISFAGLNSVIQVGDTKIGVDKLSHFMTEGLEYYRQFKEGATLEEVLKIGENEELGGYGIESTGIKSYGDLSANYGGFQFWSQLIEGGNPYLVCRNGKWIQNRKFDWKEYVHSGFDESVNCSTYKTPGMEKKVDNAVSELAKLNKFGPPLTCPMDIKKCQELKSRITNPIVFHAIVHPRCKTAGQGHTGSEGDSDAVR
ncbi:MAG TPA: hypothetical protein DCL41_07575 [Bdellovibrionales bacterium]|nr:hypothetical protein [Bdellovibrionales bacterium]